MADFEPWPKVPRWNREVVVTEKVDGTNAAVLVEPHPYGTARGLDDPNLLGVIVDVPDSGDGYGSESDAETEYHIYAQSRTRFLSPGTGREAGRDNYGFAAWVAENAVALVGLLGPGRHFGEWYGKGVARGYGLDHRRFALFNVHRWSEDTRGYDGHEYQLAPGLPVDVVPTLGQHDAPHSWSINRHLDGLERGGSVLVPGFDRPEGIILYHTAAKQLFKVLIEGDETPKTQQGRHGRKGDFDPLQGLGLGPFDA